MRLFYFLLLIGCCLIILYSCSNSGISAEYVGMEKTSSGFFYKIIPFKEKASSSAIQKGDVVKIIIHQFADDSLLNGGDNLFMPQYIKLRDSMRKFDFPEILPFMRNNDSAVCMFPIKEIIKQSKGESNIPPFLKERKNVILKMKIVNRFLNDSLANIDLQAEEEKIKVIKKNADKEGIAKSLHRFDSLMKKIPANKSKLKNGVYVQLIEKGNGKKIVNEDEISVFYQGFLDSGIFFEATPPHQPYVIHIGHNESIEGFETGIASLKIGDSAHIYIPAPLAYGENAAGDKVPKYSNLIFKVRVLGKSS